MFRRTSVLLAAAAGAAVTALVGSLAWAGRKIPTPPSVLVHEERRDMEGTRDVQRRSSRLILAAVTTAALLIMVLAGCGDDSSTQPPAVLAPLPQELVGTWTVSAFLDQSGSQQIVRTYAFAPDGRYEYTLATCRSSTDCSLVSQEAGNAQAANGILSLEPQTKSGDGPRALPYVISQDPVVGDIQLQFALRDGQVDTLYRG
jgi:hypothetical protein